MKPRNKKEEMLVGYASMLPPLTQKQRDWALSTLFIPMASYRRRGRRIKCLHCGAETQWDKPFFDSYLDVGEYGCNECGHDMGIEENAEYVLRKYFCVITTFRNQQVIRVFEASRLNAKGERTVFEIEEVWQHWISGESGKETITSRDYWRSPYNFYWKYGSAYQIKNHNGSVSGYFIWDDVFDLTNIPIYPVVRVIPLLRRNGWDNGILSYSAMISVSGAMTYLLSNPTSEMLWKTGQRALFVHMVREGIHDLEFLHSVRIANRRGYEVMDAGMWLDMLRLAQQFGHDTHNPAVVCPDDLGKAHDRFLALAAKQSRLTDVEKARRSEKAYRESKGIYAGICITDHPAIDIRVIPTVMEVLEEGNAMCHCVFRNEYYKKSESLLLSARDKEGTRLETVELSLRNFKVSQSRGVSNSLTKYHEDIIRLVESKSSVFRKCKMNAGQ